MSETNMEKEKKEKKNKKYMWKNIFAIDNGKIQKIDHEEIKDYDYIIEYEKWSDDFIIIDRDKRKIRPFVEDLLSTMNIETKQVKIMRINTILIACLLFFGLLSFYFSYSAKNWVNLLQKKFNDIQKIETIQKTSIINNL